MKQTEKVVNMIIQQIDQMPHNCQRKYSFAKQELCKAQKAGLYPCTEADYDQAIKQFSKVWGI